MVQWLYFPKKTVVSGNPFLSVGLIEGFESVTVTPCSTGCYLANDDIPNTLTWFKISGPSFTVGLTQTNTWSTQGSNSLVVELARSAGGLETRFYDLTGSNNILIDVYPQGAQLSFPPFFAGTGLRFTATDGTNTVTTTNTIGSVGPPETLSLDITSLNRTNVKVQLTGEDPDFADSYSYFFIDNLRTTT